MIASSRVLDALKAIGLNLYERKLWVALLSRGMSTAGELSDMSGVPRSRCYDVLESLASRGFVVIQQGKPIKYVAVEPREALERAKKKIAQDALDMAERIDRIKGSAVTKELERIHKQGVKIIKPEDLTGAIRGRHALHQQLGTMIKGAKKNINFVTTEEGLIELVEKHANLLQKAKKSGVDIRIAAPITRKSKDVVGTLKKFAKVRDINTEQLKSVGGRMYIVDGDKLLMALTHDKHTHPTQDVAFWTDSDHVAGDMAQPMFDLIWERAKSV